MVSLPMVDPPSPSSPPSLAGSLPSPRRAELAAALESLGALVIVRTPSADGVVELCHALAEGGCRAIELTLSVPEVPRLISEIRAALPSVLLGAGTITHVSQMSELVGAGASFLISPVRFPGFIECAHELDVLAIPGCFTPSELFAAHAEGADFVKLFPAGGLGPRYLKEILAPLPVLRILPTGGINAENAAEWLAAGARAVGVGTALASPEWVRERRWDLIQTRARDLMAAVSAQRKRSAS